ncbi:hypothetical protein K493DRAFT_406773 [Basidiobolus meristosporus CBS 931.73]|uniref:Cytoplasmic tRNA 2-thiolation protein 2 n=1 Tax=Basidiobolus meristosporus CBS 931.73 TaxID=1314790 RepID=A0A1Y1YIX8_9FUNG|nr:hypothetical protein K493DRAFT_406773 [Basidiobolus meristosporus CBS 931.73]|eukprot:ORX97935.1 hypothetical protein K493DRAFT_406773 [Basidiobolus meristosporus CBS 931.73]
MCSLQDDIDIEKKSKPQLKTCVKCKVANAEYLIRHAQYCKQCFTHTFVGKFRIIVSKSKFVVGRKECKPNVLLAFSGGPSSRALIHMMKDFHIGDNPEIKKKTILGNVKICHVDESVVCGPEEGTLKQVQDITSQYTFPFVGASLEDVFSSEYTESGDFEQVLRTATLSRDASAKNHDQLKAVLEDSSLTNREKIHALLSGVTKTTAKEDLIAYLKNRLLLRIAQRENCSIILLGDSATRIAIKCIAYTSKGRGFSLPYDVATEIEAENGIGYLRPLRDCLTKEIGIYNHLNKLETVFVPTLTTGAPIKASIDRLTEDFITGLDRDFPSTVSTVVRTASKLVPTESSEKNERCAICLRPMQNGVSEWRERITVMEMPHQENNTATKSETNTSCGSGECCGETCGAPKETGIDLLPSLCYGCQISARDMNSTILPPFMAERAIQAHNCESLREQISEFLIDDSE